jgi:hypothetical protein
MKSITLKNGAIEADILVASTMLSLEGLLEEDLLAFYELVEICRNSSHRIFSEGQQETLIKRGLLNGDGRVHSSIKNIVLSSVTGEGLGLSLGRPV